MAGRFMIAFQETELFCRYYGRFCEVTKASADSGLEPSCRRCQPSQAKQDALYAHFWRMSTYCGYLFFQYDRVCFLKRYLNG